MLMAPRVFSYQNSSSGGSTALGAFGRTVSRQQQEGTTMRGLVKVEKAVQRKGLFHE